MCIIREMQRDAVISRLYVFIDVERPIFAVYCSANSGMEATPFRELMEKIGKIVPLGLTTSKGEIDGGDIIFFASDVNLGQDTITMIKEIIMNMVKASEVLQLQVRQDILKFAGSEAKSKEEIERSLGLNEETAEKHLAVMENAMTIERIGSSYRSTPTGAICLKIIEDFMSGISDDSS